MTDPTTLLALHRLFMTPTEDETYALAVHRQLRTNFTQGLGVPADFYDFKIVDLRRWIEEHENERIREHADLKDTALRRLILDARNKNEKIWLPGPLMRWPGPSGKDLGDIYPPAVRARMEIDWTWQARTEGDARFAFGPRWKDNSCAFDTALELMNNLDAGLVHYDQHDLKILANMDESQHLWLGYARIGWRTNHVGAKDRARNLLMGNYKRVHPASTPDDLSSVVDVIDFATKGLPQVTLNRTMAKMCNKCRHVVSAGRPTEERILYGTDDFADLVGDLAIPRLDRQLAGAFMPRSVSPARPCESAYRKMFDACDGNYDNIWLVGGGLPPRILLVPNCDAVTKGNCSFGDVKIEYHSLAHNSAVRVQDTYQLIGIVGYNSPPKGHFILFWRRANSWSMYDGTCNDGAYVDGLTLNEIKSDMRSVKASENYVRAPLLVYQKFGRIVSR